MKVVLDTNLLLAAFATHGLCENVLSVCLMDHRLVLSEHILSELQGHLTGKFKLPEQHAEDIVVLLRDQATMVEPVDVPNEACRDRDDLPVPLLPVPCTALAGEANYLVSGDKDLLDLKTISSTAILDPRSFHEAIQHGQ